MVGGKLASKNTERGVMAMLKQTFLPPFMGFVEFLEGARCCGSAAQPGEMA